MAVTAMKAKNAVDSLREVVQDFLVPELRSVKSSIDVLHKEIDGLRTEIQLRDAKQAQAIQHLSEKLDYAIDIRERLGALEARTARA